jgi:hypothetical protein
MVGGLDHGRVMAAGAGWAWLRGDGGVVHVTGDRGPRGPLTAIVASVPTLRAGQPVTLDLTESAPWHTPPPPPPADASLVAGACEAARPHAWNDPRALELGAGPLRDVVEALAGRGPGLTPAGDDALVGYLLARRALDPLDARRDAAVALQIAREATGEPARSLLRAAARGEAFEPVASMLAALLQADGPAISPAIRRLAALGATTGRATLTGLIRGLQAARM